MKHDSSWVLAAAVAVTAGLVGCGGEAHRLGGTGPDSGENSPGAAGGGAANGGATGSGSGGAAPTLGIHSNSAGDAGSEGALLGAWTGYVENHPFASGSDALALTLEGALTAIAIGHLTLGTGGTGGQLDPTVAPSPPSGLSGHALTEGFPFTVENGSMDGQRLQFDVDLHEVWSDWCAGQAPIADSVNKGRYNCTPNAQSSENSTGTACTIAVNGHSQPINCAQLQFCLVDASCECTADGCAMTRNPLHFDLTVAPPRMDGSVRGLDVSPLNVHFMKQ